MTCRVPRLIFVNLELRADSPPPPPPPRARLLASPGVLSSVLFVVHYFNNGNPTTVCAPDAGTSVDAALRAQTARAPPHAPREGSFPARALERDAHVDLLPVRASARTPLLAADRRRGAVHGASASTRPSRNVKRTGELTTAGLSARRSTLPLPSFFAGRSSRDAGARRGRARDACSFRGRCGRRARRDRHRDGSGGPHRDRRRRERAGRVDRRRPERRVMRVGLVLGGVRRVGVRVRVVFGAFGVGDGRGAGRAPAAACAARPLLQRGDESGARALLCGRLLARRHGLARRSGRSREMSECARCLSGSGASESG